MIINIISLLLSVFSWGFLYGSLKHKRQYLTINIKDQTRKISLVFLSVLYGLILFTILVILLYFNENMRYFNMFWIGFVLENEFSELSLKISEFIFNQKLIDKIFKIKKPKDGRVQ